MKWYVVIAILLAGCTDEERSRKTLEESGYSDIHIGDYDAFSCGRDDTFATHFRAKNWQGKYVEGTVCCGYWKSCTVRF